MPAALARPTAAERARLSQKVVAPLFLEVALGEPCSQTRSTVGRTSLQPAGESNPFLRVRSWPARSPFLQGSGRLDIRSSDSDERLLACGSAGTARDLQKETWLTEFRKDCIDGETPRRRPLAEPQHPLSTAALVAWQISGLLLSNRYDMSVVIRRRCSTSCHPARFRLSVWAAAISAREGCVGVARSQTWVGGGAGWRQRHSFRCLGHTSGRATSF